MENSELPLYQPPRARDLSAFSASGLVPLGLCDNGPFPYYDCVTGPVFAEECVGGSNVDTSECITGNIHTWSACKDGGAAITGCTSGSGQNF